MSIMKAMVMAIELGAARAAEVGGNGGVGRIGVRSWV